MVDAVSVRVLVRPAAARRAAPRLRRVGRRIWSFSPNGQL